MDVEKHYAPLLRVTETLETQNLDFWFPMEVLELCRWGGAFRDLKGEFPDHEKRNHDRVAFSCAVILHTFCEKHEGYKNAFDSTLGNLLESLLRLDETLVDKTANLFANLLKSETLGAFDKALTHVAQLIPILRSKNEIKIEQHLAKLLEFEDAAKRYEGEHGFRIETFANRNAPQVSSGWSYVGDHILTKAQSLQSPKIQKDLLDLSTRLWPAKPIAQPSSN